MRIVSLLPSATEMVAALDLTDQLVGISHDCDYPPEIRTRPVLSEAIVTTDLPSGLIETRIRGQVHKGKSVYHLDERQLAHLRPDLILTQELCSVCAPSYTLVQQAAKLLDAETKIVSLEPLGLFDILDNILLVGTLAGRTGQAEALVRDLRARIERVRSRAAGLSTPRVACIEWLDPLYVAGHWVPEMVEIAGGRDALGGRASPRLSSRGKSLGPLTPRLSSSCRAGSTWQGPDRKSTCLRGGPVGIACRRYGTSASISRMRRPTSTVPARASPPASKSWHRFSIQKYFRRNFPRERMKDRKSVV